MIRIPKEKLFNLMFDTSKMIEEIEGHNGTYVISKPFDYMTKEILNAGLKNEYLEYMAIREFIFKERSKNN